MRFFKRLAAVVMKVSAGPPDGTGRWSRSARHEGCFSVDPKVRDTNMEPGKEVLDAIRALSSVGDDVEFLAELVAIVEAALPTLLRDIQSSLTGRDLAAVEEGARLMREAAQNVSAKRAYEAALALETTARRGEAEAAQEAAYALEEEVALLRPALAALKNAVLSTTATGDSNKTC